MTDDLYDPKKYAEAAKAANWWRTLTQHDSLFVQNLSHSPDAEGRIQRVRGQVMMSVALPSGKISKVTLEDTWLPQDLSLQERTDYIIQSRDWMNQVSRGIIKVLKDEEAFAILSRQNARDEQRRLEVVRKNQLSPMSSGIPTTAGDLESRIAEQNKRANERTSKLMNPNVVERANPQPYDGGARSVMPGSYQPPSGSMGHIPGVRAASLSPNEQNSSLGREILARYNQGGISLEDAVRGFESLKGMFSDDELGHLKALKNLPDPLTMVIASL